MRPDLTRIADSFQHDFVKFAQKLIQTKSLSGQEENVATIVQTEMERLGYDKVWRDELGNVIGLMRGGGEKAILFNSHLDHVDVGDEARWPYPPYAAVIADEFIWGRAACDTKGALAVQVYAPVMARKAGLNMPASVYTTAVVLEERGGAGTKHLTKHIKADYGILGEATANELRIGHRGRMELAVRFTGRSVHASVPLRGANPHYTMARAIHKLRDLRMVSDAVFGFSTVAPTMVSSDQTSPNVTPGQLHLTLDWRNIPSETSEQIIAKVQKLLDESLEPDVQATVEVPQVTLNTYTGRQEAHQLTHPGYYLSHAHPLVEQAKSILNKALQREIEVGIWSFATDGGHLMAADIPTIGFAPGDEHFAHTTQDRIAIAQMREAAVGYLALIENLT